MKTTNLFLLLTTLLPLLGSCGNFQDRRSQSTPLESVEISGYPETYKISGLTRISESRAYCVPTCLRMIGEFSGIREPIEYYTWITGFTYGGFYKDSFVTFMPISDTMQGLIFGSQYLGLDRVLYASADPTLITAGIKSQLSRGIPVMILYDYNSHTGQTFFFPHAAVLTGYTETEFLYFEPGFSDIYKTDETEYDSAPIETFLTGIKSLHRNFGISEGYHFMVFNQVTFEVPPDEADIWVRNGKELVGINVPFVKIATGSKAPLALADEIEKGEIPGWGWQFVLPVWITFGQYSRSDNARFIENRFGSEGIYGELIGRFRKTSTLYGDILSIMKDPESDETDFKSRIPPLLREISCLEKETGETMIRGFSR
jgi:hypothetical protein